MANPIIIVIVALLVLWLFVKFKEIRHRLFGTVILLLILSMFLTASYVIKKNSLDLREEGSFGKFTKYYMVWIGGIFSSAKQITGSVASYDWGSVKSPDIDYLPNSGQNNSNSSAQSPE